MRLRLFHSLRWKLLLILALPLALASFSQDAALGKVNEDPSARTGGAGARHAFGRRLTTFASLHELYGSAPAPRGTEAKSAVVR